MLPPIAHILPLNSEHRWRDLLAVLIEADPGCVHDLLGLAGGVSVRVRREVSVGPRDQLDLVLDVEGIACAVVEVKVLAGLGPWQLARYSDATPEVPSHILIFPDRLHVHASSKLGWKSVRWEELLDAFARSSDAWVSNTARAWRLHLASALPEVGPSTHWNRLALGEDFVIALRARMSWVFGELAPPAPILYDLVQSTAGVSWVARMFVPAAKPGYSVLVECEENLPVRDFPGRVTTATRLPQGPSVKVLLQQSDVETSAGFDWRYLLKMWPLMGAARQDWVTNAPRPKAPHDRAGLQLLRDGGGPKYLGIGFGDAQAAISGDCMFGARFQLPGAITLAGVVQALHDTADLMMQMAAVAPPEPT